MEDFPYYIKARGKFRVSTYVIKRLEENKRVTYIQFSVASCLTVYCALAYPPILSIRYLVVLRVCFNCFTDTPVLYCFHSSIPY